MATKKVPSFARKRTFVVIAAFSLLFFCFGAGLTLAIAQDLFSLVGVRITTSEGKKFDEIRQRELERQQAYVDYSTPQAQPEIATDSEKQQMLELFDKAFKSELVACESEPIKKVDYDHYRKINQYANRVVARNCASQDAMYFVNRAGEWQVSRVNIVQEFASAKSWLSACYLDDILPIRDKQPESNKYISERNLVECEYIAKYSVQMTNDQVNKAYEERFGGNQ